MEWCDWPVNECDLHARHRWLVFSPAAKDFRSRMRIDPDYFDVKVAGWWCWGLCCWIGSGWCTKADAGWEQTVLNGDPPRGVHKGGQVAHLSDAGTGDARPGRKKLNGPLPLIGDPPRGVHRAAGGSIPKLHGFSSGCVPEDSGTHPLLNKSQLPFLPTGQEGGGSRHFNSSVGGSTCAERRAWLLDWFSRLRDRLRNVRVCCGDWHRVCSSESTTTRLGLTGIFIDPPYAKSLDRLHAWIKHLQSKGQAPDATGKKDRHARLYASDHGDVDRLVAEIHLWCLKNGTRKNLRIVLAGYEGEHNALEEAGWEKVEWKSPGGYSNQNNENENAARERLWVSPECRRRQKGLIF